jgi:ABC-2 type transport system permease protein
VFKIFKRPGTYIAFGTIAAIVFLFQIALWFDGKTYIELVLSNIDASFDFSASLKAGF